MDRIRALMLGPLGRHDEADAAFISARRVAVSLRAHGWEAVVTEDQAAVAALAGDAHRAGRLRAAAVLTRRRQGVHLGPR
jgi:hypothetical protein